MALCHRCCGLYFGLLSTPAICLLFSNILFPIRRRWLAILSIPLLFDAVLPSFGIWHNTPGSRLATGFLFGFMLSWVFAGMIFECKVPRKSSYSVSNPNGGAS
jgi:uncharacterized membrane protein